MAAIAGERKNFKIPEKGHKPPSPGVKKNAPGKRWNGKRKGKYSRPKYETIAPTKKEDKAIVRVDARNPKYSRPYNRGNTIPNQSAANLVNPPLSYGSLAAVVAPFVISAIEEGLMQIADAKNFPDLPYFAYVYAVQILEAYVANTTPGATSVPRWMACLGNALRPKGVGFMAGQIEYAWQYEPNTSNYVPIIELGRSYNMTKLFFYVPSTNLDPTGFNTAVAPSSYTVEGGKRAFGLMSTFFNTSGRPMWKLVDWSKGGEFDKDVCAFSYPITVLGCGSGNGAFAMAAGNEVPMQHPILGCFASSGQLVRLPKHYRNLSADPMLIASILHAAHSPKILRVKKQIVLKCIDFYEFVDVIARWVVELYSRYSQSNVTANVGPNLGISYEQFCLCLRSLLMYAFGSTQKGVQGLWPRIPTTANDPVFAPFVAGSNSFISDDAVKMLLPTFLIENIRALGAREVMCGVNPRTGEVNQNDPLMLLPSLGAFTNINYSGTEYNYTDKTGTIQNIFTSPAVADISMWDGRKNNNVVLQISNAPIIQTWINLYNRKIEELQTFSMKLDTLGDAGGINALEVISLTNIISPPQAVGSKKADTRSDVEVYRMMREKARPTGWKPTAGEDVVGISPYDNIVVYDTTSQQPTQKDAWTEVQSFWIRPIFPAKIGSTVNDNSDVYTISTYAGEPHIVTKRNSYTNGTVNLSLTTMHVTYAQMMAKSALGAEVSIEGQMDYWSKTGRGGLLSGLVSSLAKIIPI